MSPLRQACTVVGKAEREYTEAQGSGFLDMTEGGTVGRSGGRAWRAAVALTGLASLCEALSLAEDSQAWLAQWNFRGDRTQLESGKLVGVS